MTVMELDGLRKRNSRIFKKRDRSPDEFLKKNADKLTVEAARGGRNNRYDGNNVRGTIIRISTVGQYFVSGGRAKGEGR